MQYRQELILNDTVFCEDLGRAIYRITYTEYYCVRFGGLGRETHRRTDTEYYCVGCEGLGRAI